jgi:hypothetical protein
VRILIQAAVDGHGIILSPTFIAYKALASGGVKPLLCD